MSAKTKKRVLAAVGLLVLIAVIALAAAASKKPHKTDPAPEKTAVPEEEEIVREGYTSLSYWNGSFTLSFTLSEPEAPEEGQEPEEPVWLWADDTGFPLDPATVEEVLDLLDKLEPQQTITEPEDLSTYGLIKPSATLQATNYQKEMTSIYFGKATTDGNSRYILKNGDESTVYIVDAAILDKMAVPIYDMCRLPELPVITGETLEALDMTIGKRVLHYTAKDGQLFPEESSEPLDAQRVQPFLDTLETLHFSRCVDFRPTDEAAEICGFDKPVTIQLTFTGQEGSGQTMTLEIGAKTLEPGGRYARLDGQSTIYKLDTALVNPLLNAAHGFAA